MQKIGNDSRAVPGEFSDYDPIPRDVPEVGVFVKSTSKVQRSAAPPRAQAARTPIDTDNPKSETRISDNSKLTTWTSTVGSPVFKTECESASPHIERFSLATQINTEVGLMLFRRTDKAIIVASVVPASIAAKENTIQVGLYSFSPPLRMPRNYP